MQYASFLATPDAGVTTFDALNARLRAGWRVERLDVVAHEGRVTYAFLLAREDDDNDDDAGDEALVVFDDDDDAQDETFVFYDDEEDEGDDEDGGFSADVVAMLKRDIDWERNRPRASSLGIDERFLREDSEVLRAQLLTRAQEMFLTLRMVWWLSAVVIPNEGRRIESALRIEGLLGAPDAEERWYEYLKSRAANPDDVELLRRLKASEAAHRYPGALSAIEDRILRGEASDFSFAQALVLSDDDEEEAPTATKDRARWAEVRIGVRDVPMTEEMVEAFKRDIRWEQNQHLPRARELRDEHFRAPIHTIDPDKPAREVPLDFLYARVDWQVARELGSAWDMHHQALRARRWLGEDVEREYERLERARKRALQHDRALLGGVL